MARQGSIDRNLEQAREALDRGRVKRALKHAWEAGLPASSRNDARSLQEVIELGGAIRERASGREADEAARLVAYCSEALPQPAGARPRGSAFEPTARRPAGDQDLPGLRGDDQGRSEGLPLLRLPVRSTADREP